MKIAIFQMDIMWENPQWNIEKAKLWIQGLTNDVDLAVLPEMFATGFSMNPAKIAQTENGDILCTMKKLAQETDKAIVFSMATKEDENNYNRLFFVEPSGKIHRYNKRHLFRMANEHKYYIEGTEQVIILYKGVRFMPLVCYDLRFPEWTRIAQNNADAIIYIASWPQAREHAWKTLLKARAIENQCFVIGVNRVGDDPKNHYSGNSAIIDFMGENLAQCTPDLECASIAELNTNKLNEFRANFPAHIDADNFTLHF